MRLPRAQVLDLDSALLLDFGGVLVDDLGRPSAIADAVRRTLDEAGIPAPSTVDSELGSS
jgi:hypothetical protein